MAIDVNESLRRAWDGLSGLPGGKRIFSAALGTLVPYTGTIGARVEEVRKGYSRVVLLDRRHVRNHLQCIHAIALANLAELAGNIALLYSMPRDSRFIVTSLSIDYRKKARGRITGVCECPIPERMAEHEYSIPVKLLDEQGTEVAHAVLRSLVGPKKKS